MPIPKPVSRRTLARQIAPNLDVALHNEQVTRQRVTDAETRLEALEAWAQKSSHLGWRGRLIWLILGR